MKRAWIIVVMVVLALVLVLVLGCDRSPQTATIAPVPSSSPTMAATASPVDVEASSPVADAGFDTCADIRARFNAALATRTDTCTKATDCGCYNPVGGPQLGCGGVTDLATVAKLEPIQKEFHAAKCPWTHHCAAWACAPKCVAGKCSH